MTGVQTCALPIWLILFATHGKITMPIQKVIERVKYLEDAIRIGTNFVDSLNTDVINEEEEETEE